jgi:hypothetical protein
VTRRLPRSGWVLRAVIFVAPLVALLAGVPQGHTPPPWLVTIVAAFSLAFAVMPEHYVGSATLVIVVSWWVVSVRDGLPLSSAVAAAGLLTAQLAGTVAAYGPPRLPPDRGVVLLWTRRGVLLWSAAGITWLVVVAEDGRATSASYWVGGMVAGLVLAVLATALYPSAGDRRL